MPKVTMTREERGRMMAQDPVNKVIPRLAVPTIISMLITSIYNMADTFFVGQINTSATGAVGVVFSAMMLIQAIAFTIGMGSGANTSRLLGAGKVEEANVFVSTGFFSAFILGAVVTGVCVLNVDTIVRFLGATETILPYARAYATYIFYAAPFMMCSFAMNNLLRFQGLASYGMVGMTSGGILNMLLDPLFIFVFDMGVAGAAVATAVSQFVSFAVLLCMITFKKDALHIRPKYFRPTPDVLGKIFYNGMPSLGRQGIASVATIVLNNAAGLYGDAAIAAMSVTNRYIMFINSAIIGFGQGFQPVCSYCYGARLYKRVREAFSFCLKVMTILLTVLAAVSLVISGNIIQVFRDDPEVIRIGTIALQMQLLTLPLWGTVTMNSMLTQSVGYGTTSLIISIARQGLFLIPLLFLLPPFMGLTGIQAAQPLSDVGTFVLVMVFQTRIMNKLKAQEDGQPA